MHYSAWLTARVFFDIIANHIGPISNTNNSIKVLDFGSYDRNGCLKSPLGGSLLDEKFDLEYVGIDMEPGPNVDIVINGFENIPFPVNTFDIVVSSSVFEHDPMFWMTFLHLSTVLKAGGVLYVSAPNTMIYHAFPIDAWRFNKDAGESLARWARFSGFDIELIYSDVIEGILGETVKDNVMIFYKHPVDDIIVDLKTIFDAKFVRMIDSYSTDPNIIVQIMKDFQLLNFISGVINVTNGSSWVIQEDFSLTPVLPVIAQEERVQ
jgi:SAM-dependent methyltransferase